MLVVYSIFANFSPRKSCVINNYTQHSETNITNFKLQQIQQCVIIYNYLFNYKNKIPNPDRRCLGKAGKAQNYLFCFYTYRYQLSLMLVLYNNSLKEDNMMSTASWLLSTASLANKDYVKHLLISRTIKKSIWTHTVRILFQTQVQTTHLLPAPRPEYLFKTALKL